MKKTVSRLLSLILAVPVGLSFSFPVNASDLDVLENTDVSSDFVFDDSDLDAYRMPQDASGAYILDDSISLLAASGDPSTGTGTFSGTAVYPAAVFIESSTAALDSLVGSYIPASSGSNIFFGVHSTSGSVSNTFHCTGYLVYSTGAFLSIRGSNYNTLRFRFSSLPSGSVSFYKSLDGYASSASFSGYWAVGPAQSFRTIEDFVPFFVSTNNTHVSVDELLSYGIYRIYYIQPFRSNYLSFSANYLSTFTYSYTTSLFDAYYAPDKASVSAADINNQTDSINNNLNNTVTNQTNIINNNITQETQKQTDTLTGGYDNSGMESTNQQLADSLNSFDQTESQVTDQSVEYIDAVTFFDPTTHLQLMTSVTYVSTFLQSLFVALGDWSVLVMIALSLAFALMLVGWFKYRK